LNELALQRVTKRFGTVVAVNDVDVELRHGRLLSLLGPSGCGKTTLLRLIAGLEQPDAGEIFIGGERMTGVPANRRGIGMVFQSYALFPNMSAAENIAYGLRLRKWRPDRVRARVAEMVELTQLGDEQARYPHQLSGGQQQRVALARALAIEPRLLLLDEPLSALDAAVRVALREGIRQIQQELGIATVYVTHDQSEALSISDDVIVMRGGRVEQAAEPEELYARPATTFVASFVGSANRLECRVLDARAGTVEWGPYRLHLADLGGFGRDETIVLIVRPERIQVDGVDGATPSDPNQPPPIRGVVSSRTFLGAGCRLRIETAAGSLVAEVPAELAAFERGATVQVTLPANAGLALRYDPAADAEGFEARRRATAELKAAGSQNGSSATAAPTDTTERSGRAS
jgi:putative spermidine/putrescine transport system ATP-binding protein